MESQRPTKTPELNVLGLSLEPCCFAPQTGFYRDGYCRTGLQDTGRHIVCAELTAEFLEFTRAYDAGCAPPVILEACHRRVLELISLEALQAHAL
jgi:uncharacterized protein (DUF2237 family)